MKTITPAELDALRESGHPPQILDVRLAEDFHAAHLPDAHNNPVFEIAFRSRLPETAPEKDRPTLVYGASRHTEDARMAAEKLEREGYTDVAILEGGVADWEIAGRPLDRGEPLPAAPNPPDGRRELYLDECRLEWTGRNLINKHHGTIDLTSGHLEFSDGRLTGGEITFDLRSLRCIDLDGQESHDILIGHLLDHDFLDADQHPDARLVITEAHHISDAAAGSPNLDLTADLTLRGQTHPVRIFAAAGLTPEGKAAAQATFAIDRTKWGILYGSGRFFERLAGHLVNDLIEFDARILTR